MIRKEDFILVYSLGWYQKGQMYGEFLYDVPYESYDDDVGRSLIKETATNQYKAYEKSCKLKHWSKYNAK